MRRQEYDLNAWAMTRLGIRNLDGGRGYEQGVRIVSCPLCDDAIVDGGRGWVNVQRRSCGCFNAGCPAEGGMGALEYVRRVEGYRTKTETLGMLLQEFPSLAMPTPLRAQRSHYEDWCTLPPSVSITSRPGPKPGLLYDEVRAFLKRQWSLTTQDAEQWGLRYCVQGRHAWRIIIPITMGGVLVGFQARSFRHGEPKYLTSKYGEQGEPGAECGRPTEALLFNLDAVREGDDVILVEGAGDAMALDREESRGRFGDAIGEAGRGAGRGSAMDRAVAGHGSARPEPDQHAVPVALLGLALTEERTAFLAAARPGRVIVATDEEAAAQKRGRDMMESLSCWGLDVAVGHWVGAKDAGAGAALRTEPRDDLTSLIRARFRS